MRLNWFGPLEGFFKPGLDLFYLKKIPDVQSFSQQAESEPI